MPNKKTWLRWIVGAILCSAGAALNCVLNNFLAYRLNLPLYGDTLFTVAATFAGGLVPGVATGALTNFVVYPLFFQGQSSLAAHLFGLCNVAVAVVTWLFIRLLPQPRGVTRRDVTRRGVTHQKFEKHLMVCAVLVTLSLALVAVESVFGGLVAALFTSPLPGPETALQFSFYESGLSRPATEILSRVPVNLLDRPVSVFGGYGAALLVNKFLTHKRQAGA
jgi:hypothetical protein